MKRPALIVVQIVHISGPLKGEIQEFSGDTITIGRHPSCSVRFPADLTVVSRKHAEIVREGNQFRLMDQSSNGTFVNGKSVREAFLKNGDVMMFAEGGPKASFLTEIREATGEVVKEMPQTAPPIAQMPPPPPPMPKGQVFREPPRPEPPLSRPVPQTPDPAVLQRVNVPLTIQYGPTIRSFKVLPMTIGKSPKCEFVLNHKEILDLHAQIFFFNDEYWIKDLTGRGLVSINLRPIHVQGPLRPNDGVALSPLGPKFLFLGDGRLAEVPEPEERLMDTGQKREKEVRHSEEKAEKQGFLRRVKKILKP